MFNLEQAISNWKRKLRSNPAFEDGDVAELESHLRDEVARLQAEGLSEEEAFERAAVEIGEPERLGEELYRSRASQAAGPRPPWKQSSWVPSLLPNYLKVALRNFSRNRSYALINVSGLTLAMLAFIVISVYLIGELSYDRFHENADRIYRITQEIRSEGKTEQYAVSVPGLAPALESDYRFVDKAVRISIPQEMTVIAEGEHFRIDCFGYADSSFFDLFGFKRIRQKSGKELVRPNTVVLAERTARRLFGEEDPVGRTITLLNDQENEIALEVTAVAGGYPGNSHLDFEMLASFETLKNLYGINDQNWWMRSVYTYVLLNKGAGADELAQALPGLVAENMAAMAERSGSEYAFHPQPLTAIHLHSDLLQEMGQNGSIQTVYLFAGIAVLILLVGCVNYFNLATARSSGRNTEVGIRKTLGASRGQLMKQFYLESVIISVASVALSWLLLYLSWPVVERLMGLSLQGRWLTEPYFLLGLMAVGLGVGILAGTYPALFMSHFRPSEIIRSGTPAGWSDGRIRKSLIVFQFGVSAALIAGMIVINQQITFIFEKDPGFQTEQLMVMPLPDSDGARPEPGLMRSELQRLPEIDEVAFASHIPTRILSNNTQIIPESGRGGGRPLSITVSRVDSRFRKTLGIEVSEGRDFDGSRAADSAAYIVNETAVEYFGWEEPLGKEIRSAQSGDPMGEVIGVYRNFHVKSLRQQIEPMMFRMGNPEEFNFALISFQEGNTRGLVEQVGNTWDEVSGGAPFEYYFLDDRYRAQYTSELLLSRVLGGFTILAIVIAGLGLFGLVSYSVERRRREIGIRKAMGARVEHIVGLLSRELLNLIFIGCFAALPLAYLLANQWLREYAYHIDLHWGYFALSGVIVVLIGFLPVGLKAFKAALANPAVSLRNE